MAISDEIQQLRIDCGWDQTDTPAILAKSVFAEAGELLECFIQTEETPDWDAVKSEVADVLIYAMSICIDQGWDAEEVIREKFADVRRRYLLSGNLRVLRFHPRALPRRTG